MRKPKSGNKPTEYNDKGFTLVEVIIAVVIMAIAAIPLLHAFSSTANTSSKALVKMRATNAAENIMEDIKGMSLDEVVEKYGDGTTNIPDQPGYNPSVDMAAPDPVNAGYVPKKIKDKDNNDVTITRDNAMYKFVLTGKDSKYNDDVNRLWDRAGENYTVTIEIDPTYYPNINSVNMSDFDELSSAHSAILNIDENLDNEAINRFATLSDSLTDDREWKNKSLDERKKEFGKIFKREIRLDVTKKGDATDSNGEEYEEVEITAAVSYLLYDNASNDYVPAGTETQRIFNRKLFSNTNNENHLNSVFVLFNPLYENMDKSRDIIIVHNSDSVKFNLFLIAQNTSADPDNWKDYKDNSALIFELYEKPDANGAEPVTLYTNIHDEVDYKRKEDSDLIPVKCYMNLAVPFQSPEGAKDVFKDKLYRDLVKKKGKAGASAKNFAKALNARDVDGKYLDASRVEDKIYDVYVTVEKTTGSDEWPVSVQLTGTLIDK